LVAQKETEKVVAWLYSDIERLRKEIKLR
jgi:hypothetical protein